MTTKSLELLRIGTIVSAAALTLAACTAATQQAQPGKPAENVEEITAAIQDSAMRERWRQAAASGQLPSLSTLVVPDTVISTRKRVRTTGNPPQSQRGPLIPAQAVADVRLVGLDTLRDYRGPIILRDTTAGRWSGVLGVRGPVVEIHYKLPANQRLAVLPGDFSLVYHDDVVNQSLRRELLLNAGAATLLLYLTDGSQQPYDRTLRELSLRIRQTGEVQQRVSPVEITYGDQRFILRPGERRRARDAAGEVEFFVLNSFYLQPAEIETAEGDPYHVTVLMYRPR